MALCPGSGLTATHRRHAERAPLQLQQHHVLVHTKVAGLPPSNLFGQDHQERWEPAFATILQHGRKSAIALDLGQVTSKQGFSRTSQTDSAS